MALVFLIASVGRTDPETTENPLNLEQFRFGGIGVFQQFSANTFSLQAAWIPTIMLHENGGLRGEFSVAPLKNYFGRFFFATGYELFLFQNLGAGFTLEAGGGISTWIGNGGTHPLVSGNLVFNFEEARQKIYAGYSRFFLKDYPTHEVKVGIGIDFSNHE